MRLEIVIAAYNEDVSWAKSIAADRITIYNKGSKDIEGSIRLPNVGREAHTFAYHIAENYDSLADHVIFLQGNPFDGAKLANPSNIGSVISSHEFKAHREPAFNGRQAVPGSLESDGTGLSKKAYSRYFEDTPDLIFFSPGAQWIVPKECIRSKSRNLYRDLFVELSTPRINNEDGDVNAWNMEGIWNYIFDPAVKERKSYGAADLKNESPYYRISIDPEMKYDFVKATMIEGKSPLSIWETYVRFMEKEKK